MYVNTWLDVCRTERSDQASLESLVLLNALHFNTRQYLSTLDAGSCYPPNHPVPDGTCGTEVEDEGAKAASKQKQAPAVSLLLVSRADHPC